MSALALSGALHVGPPTVDLVLTPTGAHRTAKSRAADIRRQLGHGVDLIVAGVADLAVAWAERDDITLEYPAWAAYCQDQCAALRGFRWPIAIREEAVAYLAERGMSGRGIAHALGVDEATVREAARAARARLRESAPDAQQVTAAVEAAPQLTKADRVLAALTRAGAEGLTAREMSAKAIRARWDGAWYHGPCSCVLSRLERSGAAVRSLQRRDGFAVYLHADYA